MLAILSTNHQRNGWYPIDIPRCLVILSRFLPFSPPVHQKIPHGFSTNLSRRVPKNERRLRYLLSLCFSSLSHPSSSGLSSRVPSFSSSGHNLLVFWNVASRPMGGGKINPTRLVVTCGKLLFYLSGGYWMLLGLNPKKKHSDALVIPCSILQVVDFSMGKKKTHHWIQWFNLPIYRCYSQRTKPSFRSRGFTKNRIFPYLAEP